MTAEQLEQELIALAENYYHEERESMSEIRQILSRGEILQGTEAVRCWSLAAMRPIKEKLVFQLRTVRRSLEEEEKRLDILEGREDVTVQARELYCSRELAYRLEKVNTAISALEQALYEL